MALIARARPSFGWTGVALLVLHVACVAPQVSSPTPLPTNSGPATPDDSQLTCALASPEQISAIVSQAVTVDLAASTAEACTYLLGSSTPSPGTVAVAVRREAGFESLAAAKRAFSDGQDVSGLAAAAYWSPSIEVLWFDSPAGLHAVQWTNYSGSRERARDLAVAIASVVLEQL